MFSIKWLVRLICILEALSSVWSEPTPEQQCPAPTNTAVKFTLNSRRNSTGCWISQIDFENGGVNRNQPNDRVTPAWSMGLEQSAVTCGGESSTLHSRVTVAVHDGLTPAKPIPGDYELFPGVGYYKFHPEAAIWARARQVCADEGGHLIVINSEYEANVVKQLFTRFPKEKITNSPTWTEWGWVGIYEQGANGQYFTVLDQPWNQTEFSRWHPGNPNDAGTDDCMLVYSLGGGLNDHPCPYKAPFICEL